MNDKLWDDLESQTKIDISHKIKSLVHDMNRYKWEAEQLINMMKELKQLHELYEFVENYNYNYGDGFQ